MKKKNSILIAQIGRVNYIKTNYSVLEERIQTEKKQKYKIEQSAVYTTGYTFEAVLHELQHKKKLDIDTVLLIGTATSFWGSLCSYYLRNQEPGAAETSDIQTEHVDKLREKLGQEETVRKDGEGFRAGIVIDNIAENNSVREKAENLLTDILRKKLNCQTQVRILILKKGVDEDEIKMNFTLLQKGLEQVVERYYESEEEGGIFYSDEPERKAADQSERPEIDIYLDISNGYRSLPMYIYSFASYLTRIRRENYRIYMYYGMAEARDAYGSDQTEYAPLVDLDQITDLMQWINAINEFHNMGSVRELIKIFQENREWNIETDNEDYPDLRTVFEMFEYAANAHNLKVLEDTIRIIRRMKDLDNGRGDFPGKENLPRQAVVMLQDIGEEFEERFSGKGISARFRYSSLTLNLARWFYDEGRIGSAAIAVMEGVTTYLLERFSGLDEMTIIQEFLIREPIKHLLINNNSNFGRAYDSIRNNIRNIGAHILFKEVTNRDVAEYKKDIELVMDQLFLDMKAADAPASVFWPLKDAVQDKVKENKKSETREQKVQKMLKKLKREDIRPLEDSPEVNQALFDLQKQIRRMAELEDQGEEGLPVFLKEMEEMPVLKECITFWRKESGAKETALRYGSGFGGNTGKKKGSDGLLNFFSTHGEAFISIALSLYREKVFINCSNHPSAIWSKEQKQAAEAYGQIRDIDFPEVDPGWTEQEIQREADRICGEIFRYNVAAVMCQGEFTLTYAIVRKLKERKIPALAACSSRRTEETVNENGSTQKSTVFIFERFRKY